MTFRAAGWIVLVAVLASLTGLLPAAMNLFAAYGATLVLGIVLAVLFARQPVVLACAMVVAVVVGESGLVTSDGRNLPALALALPLVVAWAVVVRGRGRFVMAPRLVIAAAIVYLAMAALSIVPSTLDGVRPFYPLWLLFTMAVSLAIVLVVYPTILAGHGARQSLLVTIAALGPLVVLSDLVLLVTGPINWAGDYVGGWVFDQLTLFGTRVPLVFISPTGFFLRPASAATLLGLSMIVLLVLRSQALDRWRLVVLGCLAADAAALVLTMNRDGWLLAAVGCLIVGAFAFRTRRVDGWALGTGVALAALLGLVMLDVVGADLRQDLARRAYGATVAGTLQGANADLGTQVRGGATLSGRQYLWQASLSAIKAKPLLGWGLGSDQTAIAGYLPSQGVHLTGYTSDSLWFVTAVERGVLGLASLLLFCLAAAYAYARGLFRRGRAAVAAADASVVAMSAAFIALLIGATFETYLLGGLTFRSFDLGLSAGLALVAVGTGEVVVGPRVLAFLRRPFGGPEWHAAGRDVPADADYRGVARSRAEELGALRDRGLRVPVAIDEED